MIAAWGSKAGLEENKLTEDEDDEVPSAGVSVSGQQCGGQPPDHHRKQLEGDPDRGVDGRIVSMRNTSDLSWLFVPQLRSMVSGLSRTAAHLGGVWRLERGPGDRRGPGGRHLQSWAVREVHGHGSPHNIPVMILNLQNISCKKYIFQREGWSI